MSKRLKGIQIRKGINHLRSYTAFALYENGEPEELATNYSLHILIAMVKRYVDVTSETPFYFPQ